MSIMNLFRNKSRYIGIQEGTKVIILLSCYAAIVCGGFMIHAGLGIILLSSFIIHIL